MVISQLSVQTTLSIPLLEAFFDSIIKNTSDFNIQDTLLCLAYLCQTQKIPKFKFEAIKSLTSLE